MMENNELLIRYNVDRNGKAFGTNDPRSTGSMLIHVDKAFTTKETKSTGVEKCLNLTNSRKIMKFIIEVASEDQLDQLKNWLQQNSKLWFKEFEKLKAARDGVS